MDADLAADRRADAEFEAWLDKIRSDAFETVRDYKLLSQHLDSDMMAYHLSRIFKALDWVKPSDTDSVAIQDLVAEVKLFEREMRKYVSEGE